MDKFNPHILLAMRYLHNPNSVSNEKLKHNYNAAFEALYTYTGTDNAAALNVAFSVASNVNSIAKSVSYTATKDYFNHVNTANKHLDEYFKLSKEDKKVYEDRVKYLNTIT